MSTPIQRHSTPNPYESQFGYSRAVRRGPLIFVSGTTSIDTSTSTSTSSSPPKILHPKSAYSQTLKIFSEIILAVEALGGHKEDIMRLRMWVKKEEDGEEVSRALKEGFGDVRPAATMLFGVTFVSGDMRVEVEADAVVM